MFSLVPRAKVSDDLIESAMQVVFGASQSPEYYRFDYMYAFHDAESNPESFVFCQELSKAHVYLAYGGTVPEVRGMKSIRNFNDMITDLSTKYRTVTTHVKNTNYPMLKIYINAQFKIIGTRQNEAGEIFVEFYRKNEGVN